MGARAFGEDQRRGPLPRPAGVARGRERVKRAGMKSQLFLLLTLPLVFSCAHGTRPEPKGTPEEAVAFVNRVNTELRALWIENDLASWAQDTNITPETEAAAAAAQEKVMEYLGRVVPEAARFNGVEVDASTRRQLELLKLATSLPAPSDPARRAELAELSTKLSSMYGKGEYCRPDGTCMKLEELSEILATSSDYDELLDAWKGWHAIAPPMKPLYTRFAELGNEGAREMGYADLGAMWRSGYDMPPDDFVVEMDRLWNQLQPMYEQLHCYTRAKLVEKYGADKVPPTGPIPAHLLGNMWSQEWGALYPMLAPYPDEPSLDVTPQLVAQGYDAQKMVKLAESFFMSLGMDPLPDTFWERSMLLRPEDREVVCHASAWNPTIDNDLRIKMCIQTNMEDLVTIHHELGHLYYYHYYYTLPVLFQSGAHDGFHEAIGDTLVLSLTPEYLHQVGLLPEVPQNDRTELNKQMQTALERLAFLPFGLLIDRWRWGVFSGEITPEEYNQAWWDLKLKYQGVAPPVARTEADFDPGAKYHIPANTPYSRYFLSSVLQFQFHRALCDISGHEGPLYTCSIYGNKEAGERFQAMLAMGASQPWPDALEALTGSRQMDASAMAEYFAPLNAWLKEQNKDRTCGWKAE